VVESLSSLDVPEKVARSSGDADVHRINTVLAARYQSRSSRHPGGTPYLVIAEINKAWTGKEPLTCDDFVGSTRLQYSADAIFMLEPGVAAPAADCVPVTVRVAKGRDGTVRTAVPLLFGHTRSRFREAGVHAMSPRAVPQNLAAVDPLAGLDDGED
jgi:hypothetical protein